MIKKSFGLLLFFYLHSIANSAWANNHSQPESSSYQQTRLPTYHFSAVEGLGAQKIGQQILPLIYQRIDLDIQITAMPASRAEVAAKKGVVDGEIMRIWDYGIDNPELIRVPTPYYFAETMPFVLKNSGIVIKSKADLAQYRIAKVRGVKHTHNMTQGLRFVFESKNPKNMFKLLRAGEVDVVLTNTLDGLMALNNNGINDIIHMDKPLKTLPLYHYIHHKKAAIVPQIDNAIKQLKKSGELAKMLKQAEHKIITSL